MCAIWPATSGTKCQACSSLMVRNFNSDPCIKVPFHLDYIPRWKSNKLTENEIKPDYPCPFSHSVSSRWFFLFGEVFWQKNLTSILVWERERRREIEVTLRDGSHMYSHLYTAEQQREREERRGRLEYSAKIPPGHKSAISRCVCSTSCKHTHTYRLIKSIGKRTRKKRWLFCAFFREGGWIQRKKEVLYKWTVYINPG